MLTIGDKFPQFNLKATVSTESVDKAFAPIDNNTYKGKWLLVFFYPKDFTFVCPTEIKGFGDLNGQFADRDCQVLAASTDVVAAVSSDRQRLILWHSWAGRKPYAEVHIASHARHRIADLDFS